jgi:hypothetical protein
MPLKAFKLDDNRLPGNRLFLGEFDRTAAN